MTGRMGYHMWYIYNIVGEICGATETEDKAIELVESDPWYSHYTYIN